MTSLNVNIFKKIKNTQLLLVFIVSTIIFLLIVYLNNRNYQDLWVLQDIAISMVIYILIFGTVTVLVTDNRIFSLICSLFIIVLTTIPNLKYTFFYGTYDSIAHYGNVNALLSLGHVPETTFYASQYSDFPGIHIFLGSISLILGVDTNLVFKLVPAILYGITPLMFYFVTKGADIRIQKGVLVASALPAATSFIVGGTSFAIPLYFCFFCVFFKVFQFETDRNYVILSLIFCFSLLCSHFVTATCLLMFLTITLILLYIFGARKNFIKAYKIAISILLILLLSWVIIQLFRSTSLFSSIISVFQKAFFGDLVVDVVPERLFVLSLIDQLRVVIVYHVKDIVILLLSLLGMGILLKNDSLKSKPIFYKLYLPVVALLISVIGIMSFQYLTHFGPIEYGRFIRYAAVFSPLLVGLFFWFFEKKLERISNGNLRKATHSLMIALIISITLISFFSYQPLVPQSKAFSPDLPEGQYIINRGMVNTVYQQRMILFTEFYYNGADKITSDVTGLWQIRGFTNESFYKNHIYFSPLDSQRVLNWDLFLLHYDGKAGSLSEKAEYRTDERVNAFRIDNNVLYDNGGSFTLRAVSPSH